MRTMSISKFKTHAFQEVKDVFETREDLVITKRGKRAIRIIPYKDPAKSKPGKLAKYFISETDIVSPVNEK